MSKQTKGPVIPMRDQERLATDPDYDTYDEFHDVMGRIMSADDELAEHMLKSPDTFGADSLFLEFFLTSEMQDDFSLIARDFLTHELPNLDQYEKIEYLDTDPGQSWPDRLFECHVLNLMMNALRGGSIYTKNLFRYLYKTYYRKEYQQLKRFQKLSLDEISDLSLNQTGSLSPVKLSRNLVLSWVFGVEISIECNVLHVLLNDFHEKEKKDADWKFMDSVFQQNGKCREEIRELFESKVEMTDMEEESNRFFQNALRSQGFAEDYVFLCNDTDEGIEDRLIRTLSVLKKTYPNRSFSKKDLILFSSIYEVLGALICAADSMNNRLLEVSYGENGSDFFEAFPPKFKPNAVESGNAKPALPNVSNKPKVITPPAAKYKEEDLLREIDGLHRKVHEQDGIIKKLHSDLSGRRRLTEENQSLKEQMEEDRKELEALRKHVYSLTEEDEEVPSVSLEEMKAALKKFRIIIIGGHSNWRQKMRKEFPDWVYIEPAVSGALDNTVVLKADYVYFFTELLSHKTYYRYINVVRDSGVKFGYLHGVNMEKTIRRMYRELI